MTTKDSGAELAEREFQYMQTYFDRIEWRNIRTEKHLRTQLAKAYELESMIVHGRSCSFEFQGVLGAITVLDKPVFERGYPTHIRLERIISLFNHGVLETYRIDCEGKAHLI